MSGNHGSYGKCLENYTVTPMCLNRILPQTMVFPIYFGTTFLGICPTVGEVIRLRVEVMTSFPLKFHLPGSRQGKPYF